DFTFVCPTEIIAFDHRLAEFEKRGVQVLGCSIDSKHSHWAWRNTDINEGGIGNIKYPLIADIDKSIARKYDVLQDTKPAYVETEDGEEDTTIGGDKALRGSFLIDEDGIVRHAVINDEPLGRDIDEMLRVVDALIYNQKHGEVCPAGWKKGETGMAETHDDVAQYLDKHASEL
ncbi:MAG: peroxiredoxin, partial [Candidatus Marinimicrobia bacterium]|nr:peroxiredoxin [Candidatus Neomarinimicrobiota bacterium]